MDRFWDRVNKTEGCWEWTGKKAGPEPRYGYFYVREEGRHRRAHRLSWEMAYGTIPEGLMVCHHCDNRICVRPEHLFLGTARDNTQDMLRKGRSSGGSSPGELNMAAKLTETQVKEICSQYKAGGVSQAELGRRYAVSQTLVSAIVRRKIWKCAA